MQSTNDQAIEKLLESIAFLLEKTLKETTKIYTGVIMADNGNGSWKVKYNGNVEILQHYGDNTPSVGKTVKIVIPQGNANLSYFY